MLELLPPLSLVPKIVAEAIRTKLFELVGAQMLESVRALCRDEDTAWAQCLSRASRGKDASKHV